jgi:hypothetical protein
MEEQVLGSRLPGDCFGERERGARICRSGVELDVEEELGGKLAGKARCMNLMGLYNMSWIRWE